MDVNAISETIKAVKNGNKNEFLHVVEHFEPRMRAFIAVRCYDRATVDDLVQEVFIFAYSHLDDFRESTNFQAWLYAIAKNKTLEELKKKMRFAKAHNNYIDYILSLRAEENFLGESALDSKLAALCLCIRKAGSKVAEFLRLRYHDNMSHREIGEVYGRNETWAKIFFFRAKNLLRKCLEESSPKVTEGEYSENA